MRIAWKFLVAGCVFLLLQYRVDAQVKILQGVILDKQSDEPIPFASIVFKVNGSGALTDSLGRYILQLSQWPQGDTLEVSSVGYKKVDFPFTINRDTVTLNFKIEVLPAAKEHEVTVKAKYNRALWFWRKIMANKYKHDRSRFSNYSYEIYNKLELDLDNVNKEKLAKNGLLKPLNFVLDYVDSTSEAKPFLPVYLTETLSDYYHQNKPSSRTREVIKATITNGIDNESIIKQLGGTYQNINIYDNTIPVFDKTFISPFNTNADNFYNFKLLDTQYLNKKRLVHFSFKPKFKGQNTFEGDCWVNDTSFAIQKITLRPQLEANINFITGLTLIQEFKLIHDSTWFLYKDKFVADLAPLGSKHIGLKGRKTATYQQVIINDSSVTAQLAKSKLSEDVIVLPNSQNLPDSFWADHRHEPLNKSEQTVYTILDTLEKNKTYIFYRNTANFLTTGTKDIGNFRIGPWYYWLSGNVWEGTRMRFDLATNYGFSKKWYLHGYLAYGFKDQTFKGLGEVRYQFSRQPWSYVNVSYKRDLDNGQIYYDQLGSDNIFALFFRKSGVPYKYQRIDQKKIEYYQETNRGLGFGFEATSKQYTALLNLPTKDQFPVPANGQAFNGFETAIKLRYAYQERTWEDNFTRYSLGSDLPIVQLRYAHGFSGVLKSAYTYDKLDISILDYIKISPYGSFYYVAFAGKTFGTLPYQFLNLQPGNDWHYYSRYSFNLMTRFEYLTDQYAGLSFEHNIGSGLFRYIPITRKWKLRQFWEFKSLIGNLSDANKQLNFVPGAPFQSLDGKVYTEIGTGIDNIFKLFRIDFIWRLSPKPLPAESIGRFGVFFGFRFSL
jgi:hypothetical protein